MKFNPCNPCCTALPAWMVRHTEISNGMHVIQANFSVFARAKTDVDEHGFPITKISSYMSYLFYQSSYTDDDDGKEYWVFKNCPQVEGNVYARMVIGLVDKTANGRCDEQIWLKPVYIKEFEYRDPESTIENADYSHWKFKFQNGTFVNTCCHLVGILGDNYLDLNGSLALDDDWEVKGYTKETAKDIPYAWATMIICPKAGTVNYQLGLCDDPGNPHYVYVNSSIGDYSFGDATPGNYWMVGYTPPLLNLEQGLGAPDVTITNYSYDTPDPNGFYLSRWSLNTFGVAGMVGSGDYEVGPTICDPRTVEGIWANSSIQTNPVYLDAACGYAYYYNNQIYYNYWPWQYWWGGYYGFPYSYFGWGAWNYGYWWNYCELGNPGIWYPWGYGWWWGGPYYYGTLGPGLGGLWSWWGGYPCGFVGSWWWWGYGYAGWWGYYGWWWWGGNYSGYEMLGPWVNNNTQENFDAWYSNLESQNYEHTWCQGYSKCQQLYSNPEGLECSLYGTAPFSTQFKVKYGTKSGTLKLSGDWDIVYSLTNTATTYLKACNGEMKFRGTMTASGDFRGSVDVVFTTTSCCSDIGIFYGPGNPKLTFFGTGFYIDPSTGAETPVLLNGTYTIPLSSYTGFGGNMLNGSIGPIQSGTVKLTPRLKAAYTEVPLTDTGFDFSVVDMMFFKSTLKGTLPLNYALVQYKYNNCDHKIDCVPKKPLLGQANLQSHDVSYTYIMKRTSDLPLGCYLIDIIADKKKYCYGLAYYEPPEGRHCLDELYPDFVRVQNPPLSSFEELPWDTNPCEGEVDLVQRKSLISDDCIPEEEDVPTPHD